jgi:hypothetical protein
MSFGAFMSGFQGGAKSMSDLQNEKERRGLLKKMKDREAATMQRDNYERGEAGLDPFLESADEDPFLFRLGSAVQSKLGKVFGNPKSQALPVSSPTGEGAPLSEDDFAAQAQLGSTVGSFDEYQPEEYELADGGQASWDWIKEDEAKKSRPSDDTPENVRRRAEQARAPKSPGRPADYVNDTTKKAIPDAPKAAGRAARAGGAVKGGVAGALAGIAGGSAVGTYGEDTGDMAREQGVPEYAEDMPGGGGKRGPKWLGPLGDPQFRHDIGVRTVGALQNLGDDIISTGKSLVGAGGADEAAPAQAIPAKPAAAPAAGPARQAPPSAVARAPGASAIPTPDRPQPKNPLEGFDLSKISAKEIPNFSNEDWKAHRQKLLKSYVNSGMSYAEAWDTVDQKVIATQQRGFLNFAKQASALMDANDLNGAATAVRAAFQYLPSTTDLEVGQYNGHLVAFGVDEETGEQVGKPIVVTPELLANIQQNFSDTKAFSEHAQDRIQNQQKDRELGQADQKIGIMRDSLGVDAYNAESKRMDVQNGAAGGAAGGFKPGDVQRASAAFTDWSYTAAAGAGDEPDPRLQSALATVALARYQQQGPSANPNSIMFRLEELVKSPGGAEMILNAASSLSGG